MSEFFFPEAEQERFVLEPDKLSRKIRARGGGLMMVEVIFATGAVGAEHIHDHEQATYCLAGSFRFRVGAEERLLGPGDSVYIPGGALHGTRCLTEGRLLDVFTPQREDFLKP